ncbi:MAG: futalosine hydrolase [Prolixibacteraceae bacterium]|nr:futalosine hydrolase [Prolixibacteraceae bacterium]
MKLLIVSATWMEVRLLADELKFMEEYGNNLKKYKYKDVEIDILITGIGTTFTTFHLTNTLLTGKYELVVNMGIAGSFSKDLQIGQVVNVVSEEFADLGIEEKDRFLTLFDSGFISSDEFPFENGLLKNSFSGLNDSLMAVRGITTNKSNGRESSINELFSRFNAHIESMEGAAVFYVCKWLGVPFLEIRAISNYIEPRDSSKWNIPAALENLSAETLKVINRIKVEVI